MIFSLKTLKNYIKRCDFWSCRHFVDRLINLSLIHIQMCIRDRCYDGQQVLHKSLLLLQNEPFHNTSVLLLNIPKVRRPYGYVRIEHIQLSLIHIFPLVGLILFVVQIKDTPISAKEYGKWALIGFCTGIAFSIIWYFVVLASVSSMFKAFSF